MALPRLGSLGSLGLVRGWPRLCSKSTPKKMQKSDRHHLFGGYYKRSELFDYLVVKVKIHHYMLFESEFTFYLNLEVGIRLL